MKPWHVALAAVGAVVVWELGWGLHEIGEVQAKFRKAEEAAKASGKPLLVVGRPDMGFTGLYGCGDICVDISGCPTCPSTEAANIEDLSKFETGSHIVFLSHVLEHVCDPGTALAELQRVAGSPDHLFIAYPRSWTLGGFVHATHTHWMGEGEDGWWFKPIPGRSCNVGWHNKSGSVRGEV